LREIVLAELDAADISAEITTDRDLLGEDLENIANKTKIGGCAQLEIGKSYRASLFGINKRQHRKNTTKDSFWLLVGALRKAMSKVD
jgi:phage replication-related protein YjqB (UPF0714/DUF867 family)